MNNLNRTILVLDGDMVAALSIARSLSHKGYTVHLASHLEKPLAAYSKAVQSHIRYPNPLNETGKFIESLQQMIADNAYALVIPVTERTLLPISNRRELFPEGLFAMASQESLAAVLDKAETFRIANSLGISVPFGREIKDIEELDGLGGLNFPMVLKPSRSVGSEQQGNTQLKVDFAFNETDLRAKAEYFLKFGGLILQRYVAGDGVGVEILARHGEIVFAFQHLRLHEVPLTGGGSTLRKSVAVDPILLEASRKLIKAINWHGVAMVEFKLNAETGNYYLMEINGRFWGSLPLAVAAGADFPGMLVDMLLEEKTTFSAKYQEGIVCRRLTSDVHWYELSLRKAAPKELKVVPTKNQMLKDLLLVFSFRHRFDVQSLSDPLPGVIEVVQVIQSYWRRLTDVIGDKLFYQSQRSLWQRKVVKKKLADAQRILFVCYGNINRSALAEHYLRQRYPDIKIEIESAGFHQQSNRPADPVMCQVAKAQGVNLDNSRSKALTLDMLEKTDVIFVMEKSHHDRLLEMDPKCRQRVFLLAGGNMRAPSASIPDPYGQSLHVYQRCFSLIAESVDQLQDLLDGRY